MLPTLRNGTGLIPAASAAPVGRLSSLFDQFFNDDFFAPLTVPAWKSLPLSMWEDDDHVYVEADAPGLTDNDIEVYVHQGTLTIRGERKCERKGTLYEGRCYGRFERSIALPAGVDPEQVEAKLANGVLSLRLSKKPESKPRKIAVKAE